MNKRFFHRIILSFLIFGMALHASGMDHILFANSSEIKLDKKNAAFKKADLTGHIHFYGD